MGMAKMADVEKYRKQWELAQKLLKHHENRGSKYPPMSIQHMPHERQRLAGKGMTDADRALRKQWILDQELSPNEPRHVPELRPKNVFRRAMAAPWDALFTATKPFLGTYRSALLRYFVPKYALGIFGAYCVYYHLKYNHKDWTKFGWNIWESKPQMIVLGQDWELVEKQPSDFNDQGFESRKVFLDKIETSFCEKQ